MATVAGSNGAPPPPPGGGNGGKRGPPGVDDGGGGKRAAASSSTKKKAKALVMKPLNLAMKDSDTLLIFERTQAERGATAMRTIQRNQTMFFKDPNDRFAITTDLRKVLAQTDIGVYVDAALDRMNMTAKEKEAAEKAEAAKNEAFENIAENFPEEVMEYFKKSAWAAPKGVREQLAGIRVLEKPPTPEQRQEEDNTDSDSDFSAEG